MGFIETTERVKTSIDNCTTNNEAIAILRPVYEAINRLANRLKGFTPGIGEFVNPLHWFREFYAPQDALAIDEYNMVEAAQRELYDYMLAIPATEVVFPDKEGAKAVVIKSFATISALETLPGMSASVWNDAITAFSKDAVNAVPLFMKGVLITADAVLDHVVKPIADGTLTGIVHILKRVLFSLWWLLLILLVVFTLPYTIPFVTGAIAGKAAAHVG